MSKQTSLLDNIPTDPQIAKDADRYVELVKEVKALTEQKKAKEKFLLLALKKLKFTRIRHGDITIEVVTKPESESLKIKKAKAAPVTKAVRKPLEMVSKPPQGESQS